METRRSGKPTSYDIAISLYQNRIRNLEKQNAIQRAVIRRLLETRTNDGMDR